ncbi:hypothetical protein GCM10022251_66740 [Phytohabitans flavus]|uniref:Uncharacterized protein n=1 Tax=Phytohabitans flavus TaxID=1076124 RepID=A0A6F8Y9G7_9ACTN|nr:hypothetical protein Pflav_090110 [Phytohabitans flavus]
MSESLRRTLTTLSATQSVIPSRAHVAWAGRGPEELAACHTGDPGAAVQVPRRVIY